MIRRQYILECTMLPRCLLQQFCLEVPNPVLCTWQEHGTLLYFLETKFGIRRVCVCVGEVCLFVPCKEAKIIPFSACHQPGDCCQFSAQSRISATVNFIIKPLFSLEGWKMPYHPKYISHLGNYLVLLYWAVGVSLLCA